MRRLQIHRRGRFARQALGGAALLVAGALSTGCTTVGTSDVRLADHDYRQRHPIMLSEEPEVMDIPVGMNGPAISRELETAVDNYVAGYRENGTGALTIQVPTASANAVAAAKTGHAIHYALVRAGVPQGQIEVAPYHVGDHAKVAKLRLSYLRVKAVAPKCGIWPETAPVDYRSSDYHNFGCATQQNLAAMVANPADLVQPQPMTPPSGTRRAKVILDYSGGNETKSNNTLEEADVGG
jgi:pilus assembly protein CpaD